jgi:hypothetical protein
MPIDDAKQAKVISLAQILLRDEADETKRSPSAIGETVRLAATTARAAPEDYDEAEAIAELVRRFSQWVPDDAELSDPNGHDAWLVSSIKKDWRYWQRLQSYLERSLPIDVVDALDQSTDGILGQLENPAKPGPWDRRGLVVGHVQSGKTSSYSALICKAADAGYKIIVVLAGKHNNLRSQTQIRLEEAFLGYETSPNRDPGNPLGVFFEDRDPSIHPHCATTREDNGDFNTAAAKRFSISPEERPWLFVVKKNKTVLTRLLKWMQSNHVANGVDAQGNRIVNRLPLLVIDDEADHASIDTGEQDFIDGVADPDHEPKAINSLIRKILKTFSKSAYVGYTATPFANVFIHRRGKTAEEGDDLYPRSFIRNLAAPSNYVGPARVFGLRDGRGVRIGGLPLTREIEDHVNSEGGGWMPGKHSKAHTPEHDGTEALPPSLRKAIQAFALTCSARACRGQRTKHCSMLVHVTRFTAVQNEVRRQVEDYVKRMKQRITRKLDHEALLKDLQDLWAVDFIPTTAAVATSLAEGDGTVELPSWSEIEAALPDALSDIVVKTINGSAKDALDYVEKEATGLKVIAIGGDKLARGLTLEGLTTSYFIRTTKMYDTLMQMGRWFGYRPGYLDLCRLYTTPDLIRSFGLIADAAEELREEFDEMVAVNGTPDKYGIKVASHPSLLVTSPMKMRSAQTIRLSYSGVMVQTVSFRNDKPSLRDNLALAENLLSELKDADEPPPLSGRPAKPETFRHSHLWRDVPAESVIGFLRGYVTPPGIERANGAVMAEFIEKMTQRDELGLWTVALVAEGKTGNSHTFANGIQIDTMPGRGDRKVSGKYSIGVLTDPADEAIDVDQGGWEKALALATSHWKRDPQRGRETPPTIPNGRALRELRSVEQSGIASRGLLLIYPLSPKDLADTLPTGWDKPIIGFAVSFPTSGQDVSVEYKVDHLLWEEQYGVAE